MLEHWSKYNVVRQYEGESKKNKTKQNKAKPNKTNKQKKTIVEVKVAKQGSLK